MWNLVINLLNIGIREALHSAEYRMPSNGYGGYAVAFFVIGLILQLVPIVFYLIRICCTAKRELNTTEAEQAERKKKGIVDSVIIVVQTLFVSVCYYIGDNLYPTLREYATDRDLRCGEQCLMKSQAASLGFLTIASFMLHFSKDVYESILKIYDVENQDEKPFYYKITNFVVTVVRIDIIYSTVIGIGSAYDLTNTDKEYCQDQSKA